MKLSKNTLPIAILISGIVCLSTAAYAYYNSTDYDTKSKQTGKHAFAEITQDTMTYASTTQIIIIPTPTPSEAPTPTPLPTDTPDSAPKPTQTPNPLCKISVSYSASLTYNNHVGNDWGYDLYVGNELVERGSTCTFEINDDSTFAIKCYATEYDSISDNGSSLITVKVAELAEGKTRITQEVIVRENRGRYSGNTACWTFTITIKKQDYD